MLKRLGEHQQGRGARLVEVITQAGITFRLARTWPGVTRTRERQLKQQGGASRRCPICLDQPTAPGQRHAQTATQPAVPTRGTTPAQARAFLNLNPKFARPVAASPAKQWGRVRGREQIELLSPRVTGAWFEENAQPSQHRAHAVVRRGVQARVQARQHHLAERAEQQRAQAIAGRARQRLASAREACPPVSGGSAGSARRTPMSAEEPTATHPFTQAQETWDAWSLADTMRTALAQAREQGDHETLAGFEQHPEWTQGPGPLEALRANRTQVELLTGWRWQAVRDAREQGHAWVEVGEALGTTPEQARQDYLDRIEQERHQADRYPHLAPLVRYEPRWAELAEPNAADRAHPAAPGHRAGGGP